MHTGSHADESFQMEGAKSDVSHREELDSLSIPAGKHATFHMFHTNHLDLTWYWRLPDSLEMCQETIRWHVDLLEKHPDARYSHSQVFILRVVETVDPALFERFRALVREGRVELDSGQVVEPDHNLPAGESIARQFLYGQRYLESRFGVTASVLINSDSFGHARSLPQILDQAGIRAMMFKRPREKHTSLPEIPFRWRGIDGTEVTALRFINKGTGLPSLSQGHDLSPTANTLQEKVNRNLSAGFCDLAGTICNSDAGGVSPYVRPIEGDGVDLVYSTPSRFFQRVLRGNQGLAAVDSPLNFPYPGCYTTHIHEKENCRRIERELREAEILWVLAFRETGVYPYADLQSCWWRFCYLQFHDIITGTGTPEAHQDSRAHYHELFLHAGVIKRRAQFVLNRLADNAGTTRSFAVVNPHPYRMSAIAEVDVEMPLERETRGSEMLPAEGVLVSPNGMQAPYQIVSTRAFQRYVRGTMLFPVSGIAPLTVETFRLEPGIAAEAFPVVHVTERGAVIANEHYEIRIGGPGIIQSIIAKKTGKPLLRDIADPVCIELWPETDYAEDYNRPMKAWQLGITGRHEKAVYVEGPLIVDDGVLRKTVRMKHTWGASAFITDVSLYNGMDYIGIRSEIDWQERDVLVRLCILPELIGPVTFRYGIPYGHETATGEETEVPAVGWVDLSGPEDGMALFDRGRPGHTFRGGGARVSLVRCSTGDYDPRSDGGRIESSLRLVFHKGFENTDVPRQAAAFAFPPVAWQVEREYAEAKAPSPLCCIRESGIEMAACKLSEDRRAIVLRFRESRGRPVEVSLETGADWEIAECRKSDLMETKGTPVRAGDRLSFRPFEVKTVRLELEHRAEPEDLLTKLGL